MTFAAASSAQSVSSPNSGTESFLVGLSPTFWSHVHLCISEIHRLKLIDGVHCLLLGPDGSDTSQSANDVLKLVPISRCRIIGCIVSVERKASGSTFYVLDDGTGLLDCVAWEASLDELPPLLNSRGVEQSTDQYQVGDVVEVMGRVECVGESPSDGGTTQDSLVVAGRKLSVYPCAGRELHVSLIGSLSSESRATPGCLDAESRHMLQSYPVAPASTFYNANDVLEWLGPELASQVEKKQHFPSVDDKVGAWKLFGSRCPCECDDLKTELLYCHCIAKPLDLDPRLVYRDALLRVVLHHIESRDSSPQTPFFVHYRELVEDTKLKILAREQMGLLGRPPNYSTQLLLQTIRALRDDGILHLYDSTSDVYLLISRAAVLEPYVQLLTTRKWEDQVVRTNLKANKPSFLRNVPRTRIDVVRRTLEAAEKRNGSNSSEA